MYRTIAILMILLLSCVAAGCALPLRQADELARDSVTGKQAYWWFARYKITWPEGAEPDWRVDLLLADAVIKPVLNTNRQQIRYWRFHRRAIRDDAGHQFSFLFYTDRDTAGRIYAALTGDKLTGKLIEKNILQKVVTDNLENNHQSGVQDTSDKNWSETLQIAWPAYIMGVSDMWLQLIGQNVGDYAPDADVDELLQRFGKANDRITALWQKEGQHAFLHHLNAIFGYEPISINKAVQF
jgi:hypothetical protein